MMRQIRQHGDRPVPPLRRQPQPRDERADVLQRHLIPRDAPAARQQNQSFRSWAYDFTVFGDFPDELRKARNRSTAPTGAPSSPKTVHDTASHGITTRCTRTEHPRHLRDGRRKVITSTTDDGAQETPVTHVKDSTETARDNVEDLAGELRLGGRREYRRRPVRLVPAARPVRLRRPQGRRAGHAADGCGRSPPAWCAMLAPACFGMRVPIPWLYAAVTHDMTDPESESVYKFANPRTELGDLRSAATAAVKAMTSTDSAIGRRQRIASWLRSVINPG